MTIKKSAAAAAETAKSADDAPADVAPADGFSPSGAPRQTTDIPVNHPAIDNDPRAGTTVTQNRIDMNDPTKDGAEVVAEQLKKED